MFFPFVNRKKLRQAIEREYYDIEEKVFVTRELAEKFGVTLKKPNPDKPGSARKLDVPNNFRLIRLFSTPAEGTSNTYKNFLKPRISIAIGMRRGEGDPKTGEVRKTWDVLERPEPAHISVVKTEDATCFAKLHFMLPLVGEPRLLIWPIQHVAIRYDLSPVDSELIEARKKGGAAARKARRKLKTLYAHGNVFDHHDRHAALALVALELAHRLGIRKIELPPIDRITHWSKGFDKRRPASTVKEQYDLVANILRQAAGKKGFKIIQKKRENWW